MGNRLHVATEYHVRWSNTGEFNWKSEEFQDLLWNLGVEILAGDTEEFEVYKEDWLNAIEKLKNYGLLDEEKRHDIDSVLENLEYTKEEVIEAMEKLYKEADPNLDYLKCSFL